MQLYVLHLLLDYITLWLASSCTSHSFTSYYLDEFKSSILVLNFNISLSHTSRLSISLCQHRITCHLLGCHAFLLELACVCYESVWSVEFDFGQTFDCQPTYLTISPHPVMRLEIRMYHPLHSAAPNAASPVFDSNQDYRSTELSTMLSHNSSTLNRWFEPHTPLFPALLSTYFVVAPELIRPACLMYGLWRSFQVLRKPLSSFLLSPYVGRLPSQIGHSSPYRCDHSFFTTLLRWVYIMYSYLYHT